MKTPLMLVAVLLSLLANSANAAIVSPNGFAKGKKTVNVGPNKAARLTKSGSLTGNPKAKGAKGQGAAFIDKVNDPLRFSPLTNNLGGPKRAAMVSYSVQVVNPLSTFVVQAAAINFSNSVPTTLITNAPGPAAVPLPGSVWLMAAPLLALMRKRKAHTV